MGIKKKSEKQESIFDPIEVLDYEVCGDDLVGDIQQYIAQYIILPDSEILAISLWIFHTYTHSTARVSPILGVTSPDKRCGKSTLMSVLNRLSCKPLSSSNVTPAVIFRTIEKYQPTLIIDEADTFIKGNNELRGIINSGHTRDTAYVIRTSGDDYEPARFSTWCPKAIASIGKLPDTIADRSIEIRMARKLTSERVSKLPLDDDERITDLRSKLYTWAIQHQGSLGLADPEEIKGLNDRAQDNWSHLTAIAWQISENVHSQAICAAMALSSNPDTESVGTMLINDLMRLFNGRDRMFTEQIISDLVAMDNRPWGDYKDGRPFTFRQMYRILSSYGIRSKSLRIGDENKKGIDVEQVTKAFERYGTHDSTVTASQVNVYKGSGNYRSVTIHGGVTDGESQNLTVFNGCDVVTDKWGDWFYSQLIGACQTPADIAVS